MILFKLKCVTCQAGLAVHDESLIGQIVACPKCGSMVEVLAPASFVETRAQPTSDTEPPAEEPSPVESPELAPPAEVPESAAANSSSNMLLIGGAIGSIVLGTVLVGLVLWSGDNEQATPIVEKPAAVEIDTSVDAKADAPLVEEDTLADKLEEVATEPFLDEPSPVLPLPEVAVNEETQELASTDSTVPVAEINDDPIPPVQEIETSVEPVRVARRTDLLYLDTDDLDLQTLEEAATNEAPASHPSTAEMVLEVVPPVPVQDAIVAVPAARRNPAEATYQGNRDAKAALKQSVPALEFKEIPLVYFLRLISQLSGVPVSVSPEELLTAGISLRKPVSLSEKSIRLSEALQKVLTTLKLEYLAENGQIVVVRKDAAKQREINYPIEDLISSSADETQIASWIMQLVAPRSWQKQGGAGTIQAGSGDLRISQTQHVHYQVLIFLERWRLARDLPLKSRFPVKRLIATSPWFAMESELSAPVTFSFSEYTPLGEIIAYWERELGTPIFIDWTALTEVQLWPQSEITCSISKATWSQALDQVLLPLGLGWRAAPGKSIEITTVDQIEGEPTLDIFSLPTNQPEAFNRVRRMVDSLAKPGTVLMHEPDGNILFSLQPASVQREIAKQLRTP